MNLFWQSADQLLFNFQEYLSDGQFVTGQEGLNLQECWNDISLHTLCDSFAFYLWQLGRNGILSGHL